MTLRSGTVTRKEGSAVADPTAREFLRGADPVLRELIDARPDFHPRAWLDELPPLDAFGTLIFQVVGQQLSVAATRTIVARLQERFGGRMPSPQELISADPRELRASGMSSRKAATLRIRVRVRGGGRMGPAGVNSVGITGAGRIGKPMRTRASTSSTSADRGRAGRCSRSADRRPATTLICLR